MIEYRRILVIGAHPDDIELGCFGTLLKAKDLGAEIYVVIMASCEEDGWGWQRVDESRAAFRDLADRITFLNFSHDELVPSQKTVQSLSECLDLVGPDVILTHTRWDTHQDHRAVEQITMAACRRRAVSVLGFHAISSTPDFPVNLVVDISDVFPKKLKAIACHTLQAHQPYMQESWLEKWHYQKLATSVGYNLVELFHIYCAFTR